MIHLDAMKIVKKKMMNKFKLNSRFYYQSLSEIDKRIYRTIYEQWQEGKSIVTLYLPGKDFYTPSGITIHQIVQYILNENPHIFHLETSQFSYIRKGNDITIKADAIYTHEEYEEIYNALLACVENVTSKVECITDEVKKIRFLHDYLAENIVYDYGTSDKKSQREVHTIVGALLNGACVCDGYAKAFRLLCDKSMISNIVVVGDSIDDKDAGPHAWNIVKVNQMPYHVDVTWDSILSKNKDNIIDFYFLRNDEVFSFSHKWNEFFYPKCKFDYQREYPLLINKQELEIFICKNIKNNRGKFVVYLPYNFPNSDEFKKLINEIISRNKKVFERCKSFSFNFYEKIEQNIFVEIEFCFL